MGQALKPKSEVQASSVELSAHLANLWTKLQSLHPELAGWTYKVIPRGWWDNLPAEPLGYTDQQARRVYVFHHAIRTSLEATSTLTHETAHALAGSGHGRAFCEAWKYVQDSLPLTYWDRLWLQSRRYDYERAHGLSKNL